MPAATSLESKFWSKVDLPETPDECWKWKGTLQARGYGCIDHFTNHRPRKYMAHRVSWMIHFGPIPDGLLVCHTCDQKTCVNPHHLFIGTAQDNSNDMIQKVRYPLGEKHWASKLTEHQVLEMRRSYAQGGITMQALANEYGVGFATAREAIRGITWSWLRMENVSSSG